eukprot:scaffold869_cov303-Pinguiococcus_pyrenoidosus.AAC.16
MRTASAKGAAMLLLALALERPPASLAWRMQRANPDASAVSRRTLVLTGIAAPMLLLPKQGAAGLLPFTSKDEPPAMGEAPERAQRPTLMRIEMNTPPTMQPFSRTMEKKVLQESRDMDALVFGLHSKSGSPKDAELAVKTLQEGAVDADKKLALALAMFTRAQQDALNAFVDRQDGNAEAAEAKLLDDVVNSGIDQAVVQAHLPILRWARQRGVPLIAVGIPPSVLQSIEKSGLDGVSSDDRNFYVPDADVFLSIVRQDGFSNYAQNVILDDEGSRDSKNTFAATIFRHEGMASGAARWLRKADGENPRQVVLVADVKDVVFGFGAPERLRRLAPRAPGQPPNSFYQVRSFLLNPTAKDSCSDTTSLRLALGISPISIKTSFPLADFVSFSESPAVNLLTRMNPPLKSSVPVPGVSAAAQWGPWRVDEVVALQARRQRTWPPRDMAPSAAGMLMYVPRITCLRYRTYATSMTQMTIGKKYAGQTWPRPPSEMV